MREIKFRVWDEKHKRLFIVKQPYHLQLQQDSKGKISWKIIDCELGCQNISSWDKDSKNILMQYTGLKDKNGKDIYEGDIIAIPSGWNYSSGLEENVKQGKNRYQYLLGVVVFGKGMFRFNSEIEAIDKAYQHYFYEESGIMVGNIYKNKELLK